jgi:hypothetical protein
MLVQVKPLPEYPGLHVQTRLPQVALGSLQVAFASHATVPQPPAHSSTLGTHWPPELT